MIEYQTFGQRIAQTTRQIMRVILGVAITATLAFLCLAYWGTYDEGVRAGTVLRISKKGMLFKTYEGQMNLQTFGALKGANPIMEAFNFSVSPTEEQVIRDLQTVALSGERVNLHYEARYLIFPWRGDTKYFITNVERVAEN